MQGTGDVVGKLMAENDDLRREQKSARDAEAELERYAQYVTELTRQVKGWSEKCSEQSTELAELRAIRDRASWTSRLWRDWPQARRDAVRRLSMHLADALEDLGEAP